MTSASLSDWNLELRSVETGRVVEKLGPLGKAWTNNGFAFSPDGRYVYFTLIPSSRRFDSLLLEQMSVATHKRRFIALGEQPAISSNGQLLAYAAGEGPAATILVHNLVSGEIRSINVSHLLGSKTDLLNASLAWQADGTHLALFEACCAVTTSSAITPAPSRSSRASYVEHLIVISVPSHGGLTARSVLEPGASGIPLSVGTDTTGPNSLILSSVTRGDRAVVDRLTIGSTRATLNRILTIAHALVVGFDPSGQRLLYLLGHSPPNLWVATIANGRLTQRHMLITNASLAAVAW